MAYTEAEARKLVILAAHRLVDAGLTARTWGNLSARISDEQFVITPSGLGYDIMEPEDLVVVNISDLSYEGNRKPSSEKGIHADAYRLRPEVNFVIHTHQDKASVYGIRGWDLSGLTASILGKRVPCAAYGLPGTEKLRQAVADALSANPSSQAVLMKAHGALCLGADCESAFQAAEELEKACAGRVGEVLDEELSMYREQRALWPMPDYGRSQRKGHFFKLKYGSVTRIYDLRNVPADGSSPAAIHAAIYRSTKARYIIHVRSASTVALSILGKTVHPYLDDLAQIAGPDVRCARFFDDRRLPRAVSRALLGRNAALLEDCGGFCIGKTADDVTAAASLLEKGCEAALYAKLLGDCEPLSPVDARLQRLVYQAGYSHKKGKKADAQAQPETAAEAEAETETVCEAAAAASETAAEALREGKPACSGG